VFSVHVGGWVTEVCVFTCVCVDVLFGGRRVVEVMCERGLRLCCWYGEVMVMISSLMTKRRIVMIWMRS
jgi:hypothetical protein